MPAWLWLADGLGSLLLIAALGALAFVVRRRWIGRNGGSFEFSIRVRPGKSGRGWVLGIGRYSGDALEWFRTFSFAARPKMVLARSDLRYISHRTPAGVEVYSIYAGHVIVTCAQPGGRLEVAMSPEALTGFQAWLESAPPGQAPRRH